MTLFGQVMHVQNSFGHHTGLRVSRTVLRTAKNPDRDVFASIAITPLVCFSRYEELAVSAAANCTTYDEGRELYTVRPSAIIGSDTNFIQPRL
jgi:hypothetical protein